MKTWITSDIHFSHANILKYCPGSRPFKDEDHMNEEIIRIWNQTASPGDLVYLLGDVAFCGPDKARAIIKRLNGDIILIVGNHDRKALKSKAFKDCFKEVHEYLEINVKGTKVVLFHYPIFSWNGMYRGSIHLYGHSHGNKTGIKGRTKDVGMDTNNCNLYELEPLVDKMLQIDLKRDHHEDNYV
jgi:calcineurin-like phosphoesterase family protein